MWSVAEMTTHINLVTDESFSSAEIRSFINDAIGQLNIYSNANFPFLSDQDVDYTAIPEKWQRQLFVPYAAARIKQNDSSQFEYNDWYGQYSENIIEFRSKFIVPEEYQDKAVNDNPLQDDLSTNIYGGDW